MSRYWTTLTDLKENNLIEPDDALETVAEQFQIRVSPAMQQVIGTSLSDPVYRQFIPSVYENTIQSDEVSDPIGDIPYTPVPGIVHRYPDRALLKITQLCAVYCRFCFRKEMVGRKGLSLTRAELEAALDYIQAHKALWEIILSGGDPLILSNERLQPVFEALCQINHLEVIRIHTRIPVVSPTRIDLGFLELLKKMTQQKSVYIVIHSNHAAEFTKEAFEAVAMLRETGAVLLSQSVLLKGVNDNIEVLTGLMRLLVRCGIKPYYLHQLDYARGTSHFRVKEAEALSLIRALRARLSGLCIPTLIQEIPGGKKPLY